MKAPCPHFGKCSGCTQQQFPYEKQLRDKQKQVCTELGEAKNGALSPIIASPAPFGYRTTTKLCLDEDAFGRKSIGLFEPHSKKVTPIPGCPVHHNELERLVTKIFRNSSRPLTIPYYNHRQRAYQAGRLKFFTARTCPQTGQTGIVLSHTGVPRADLLTLVDHLDLKRTSVWESVLAPSDGPYVLGAKSRHLCGAERTAFVIGLRSFLLSPVVFFQANSSLSQIFVESVVNALGKDSLTQRGTLLDLYGGFGAYAAAASPLFATIDLVDGNPQAAADAQINFTAWKLPRVRVFGMTVEAFLETQLRPGGEQTGHKQQGDLITHAIVNPPRAGLSKAVIRLLANPRLSELQTLVYVSCDTKALARNIAGLKSAGWRLDSVQPFDMFPQTSHVECVARLVRRSQLARAKSKQSRFIKRKN